MDHILCMFEEYEGTTEWERLGCSKWITLNGKNITVTPETDEPPVPTDFIDGGGWTKVRHTAQGNNWGPFRDQLKGTEVTGNPENDAQSWSVKFDDQDYSEILFASGDLTKWMVMDKEDVN